MTLENNLARLFLFLNVKKALQGYLLFFALKDALGASPDTGPFRQTLLRTPSKNPPSLWIPQQNTFSKPFLEPARKSA